MEQTSQVQMILWLVKSLRTAFISRIFDLSALDGGRCLWRCCGCHDDVGDLLRGAEGELWITIGAVLLFSIAGLPAPAVALHRAPAIALGSDVWRPCFDIVHQIGLSWECDWRSIC